MKILLLISFILLFCLNPSHARPENFFTKLWGKVEDTLGIRSDPNVVHSNSGKLRGQVLTSRSGESYHAFLGIPFAEKPNRFEPAVPVKPWGDIRDALIYSSICPQIDPLLQLGKPKQMLGDEDCLYLNIFSPVKERCKNESAKLPILFHIHGGGFTSGSGQLYDPHYFMDECIVYVSANYRLGALGFLTTNDGVIPGNIGLKDALLALKWTSENAQHFRGNKDSVTLTGIGAGGIIVSHFLASPAAKGLFHRVIAQSGSSFTPLVSFNPKRNAVRLGRLLDCGEESSEKLKKCLSTKTFQDIVLEQQEIKNWDFDFVRFSPVVEPTTAVDAFQTESPYLRIKRGEGSQVPLITGVSKDEGILLNAYETLASKSALDALNAEWYHYAPKVYLYDHLNVSPTVKGNISDQIKDFYLKGKRVSPDTAQGFTDSESDRYFNYGSWEEALLHSKYAPVYHYALTFQGNFSLTSLLLRIPYLVVSHGHDDQFLYKMYSIVPEPEQGSDRLQFSHNIIKLWTSFVQTGVPTALWSKADKWIPFTASSPSTLILDIPCENKAKYRQDRMEFWKNLKLRELEFPDEEKKL